MQYSKKQLEQFAKARAALDSALAYTKDDDDRRRHTSDKKIAHNDLQMINKKEWWASKAGQQLKKQGLAFNKKTVNKLQVQIRDRGLPCMIIEPNGKEHKFEYQREADKQFGTCMSKHFWDMKPGQSKRIQRRQFKNWIFVRLDGVLDTVLLAQLKQDVKQRIDKNNR